MNYYYRLAKVLSSVPFITWASGYPENLGKPTWLAYKPTLVAMHTGSGVQMAERRPC